MTEERYNTFTPTPRKASLATASGSHAGAGAKASAAVAKLHVLPLRANKQGDAQGNKGAVANKHASTSRRSTRRSGSTNFMRYANDNRIVRALYEFTSGRYRVVFMCIVCVAVFSSVYFPVRDLYVAKRTNAILTEQMTLRQEYEDTLQSDVNDLLSEQGIKDTARESYGLVDEGESTVTVQGLDELMDAEAAASGEATSSGDVSSNDTAPSSEASTSGTTDDSASSDDSPDSSSADASGSASSDGKPSNSTELEAAINAVGQNAPWYTKMLDAFFFYDSTTGQAITSTGE